MISIHSKNHDTKQKYNKKEICPPHQNIASHAPTQIFMGFWEQRACWWGLLHKTSTPPK